MQLSKEEIRECWPRARDAQWVDCTYAMRLFRERPRQFFSKYPHFMIWAQEMIELWEGEDDDY